MLVEVGRRLADLHGPAEAARLGGDEFAVLLPGLDATEAGLWGHRVAELLDVTFRVGDAELVLKATVGVATCSWTSPIEPEDSRSEALSALLAVMSSQVGQPGDGCQLAEGGVWPMVVVVVQERR